MRSIAGGVTVRQFPDCLPRTYVRPAVGDWHHRRPVGAFHQRVVDRFCLGAAESVRIERHEVEIGPRHFDGRGNCGPAFGLEAAIFFQQETCAEHEVAGVPQIAFGHIARRGFGIGLFHEPLDGE